MARHFLMWERKPIQWHPHMSQWHSTCETHSREAVRKMEHYHGQVALVSVPDSLVPSGKHVECASMVVGNHLRSR